MSRHHLGGRDESFCDGQFFHLLASISTLFKVDLLNILAGQVIFSVREGLDLFQHDVVDVQPSVSKNFFICAKDPSALHVVEGMEQRVDEPCSHLDKRRKLRLEQTVVVLVFARGEFKVLLDLESALWTRSCPG